MRIIRLLLAFPSALVALILTLPVLILWLPFWIGAILIRSLARLLEPHFLPWNEMVVYDPKIGWKPKANLDAYGVAEEVFHLTTDPQGWRGSTSLAESQMVVFGDSFAFGYGVDDQVLFSAIKPDLRIKPIGSPGYNMVQPLLLMRQLSSQFHGKLIVWFIYLGNDLYENITPDMQGYRLPFVRRRNGKDSWEIVTSHVSPDRWPYSSKRRRYLHLLAELCSSNFLSERVYSACEFLIKEGHHVCSRSGAQLVVMTIPDSAQLSRSGQGLPLSKGDNGFDPDFPDQRIAEICRKLGVSFVAGKKYLMQKHYKERDVHWNERGHQRVAEVLYQLYQNFISEPEATIPRG